MTTNATQQPNTELSNNPNRFAGMSSLTDSEAGAGTTTTSGANHQQSIPFPWKLHDMLDAAEKRSYTSTVSWLPDQSSFKVHQPEVFVKDVMPQYFRQTKYKSFQRQLNMWGFERLLTGPDKGGYSHVSFVRGQPALCRHMKRLKIKGTGGAQHAASSPVSLKTPSIPVRVVSQQHHSIIPSLPSLVNMILPTNINTFTTSNSNFCFTNKQSLQQQQQQQKPSDSTQHIMDPSGRTLGNQKGLVDDDMFDQDTFLSVLSSAMENRKHTSVEKNAPENGDCVLFEGMQFFFVEDYSAPSCGDGGRKPGRRMPIELNQFAPSGRRMSLIGVGAAASTSGGGNIMNQYHRSSRRFSIEEMAAQQVLPDYSSGISSMLFNGMNDTTPATRRQNRRFSLQRGGSLLNSSVNANKNYVLREEMIPLW